jgi:hypothetical protein
MRGAGLASLAHGRTPKEALLILFSMVIMVGSTFYICHGIYRSSEGPSDMRMGQRVVYQMMGQQTLEHLGFFERDPEAEPSDFVAFIDSEEGEVLWPPTMREHGAAQRDYAANYRPIEGRLLRPNGLEYNAYEPDPTLGRQLVYFPDDEAGVVHIHGYDEPFDEPVHRWVYEFPTEAMLLEL